MFPTEPSKIFLLIYFGPELNGESCILAKASSREMIQKLMHWIAETQGLHKTLLSLPNLIYEEIMIEINDIQSTTFDQVMVNPHDYGNWEKVSIWSIVNHDFSKITTKRFEQLIKKLNLPKLNFSVQERQDLLEYYSE